MLIDEFLSHLAKEKRYAYHTIVSYKRDLLDFHAYCKETCDYTIDEAVSKMVRSWFSFLMENNYAPRSVRRKSSSLKSYYKFLLTKGALESSPMVGVPLPKVNKKLPEFVEEKSMVSLFSELSFEKSYLGVMERLILELFYDTGMRLSELLDLKVQAVDLNRKQLKVLGKRNKERIIPFSFALGETISRFMAYRRSESPFVFVLENGKRVYTKMVYRIVNKHLNKVTTIQKKSPHILRHTFATHMLDHGAELNAIKELLGHSSLAATQVYTHSSLEKIKSVYKQAHPRA